MYSSVSPKDGIWFLRVCHHISNAVYELSELADICFGVVVIMSILCPLHLKVSIRGEISLSYDTLFVQIIIFILIFI